MSRNELPNIGEMTLSINEQVVLFGNKEWWNLVKQQPGFIPDDSIPPLDKPDGLVGIGSEEQADIFAFCFTSKMRVPDPDQLPSLTPTLTGKHLASIDINTKEVEQYFTHIDAKTIHGPDSISQNVLRKCAHQLSA